MAGLSPWRRKTTVEHVPSGTVPDTDMRTAVRALPCVLLPARKALDTCEALSSMAIVEMSIGLSLADALMKLQGDKA